MNIIFEAIVYFILTGLIYGFFYTPIEDTFKKIAYALAAKIEKTSI